jgi:predicted dehydrogenase
VIGAGRIGRTHLETLAGIPTAKPIILSDVVESVLKEVAAKYGVPSYTLNADEVINHPEVQAVWICSPSQFHADQIKKCAAAGLCRTS